MKYVRVLAMMLPGKYKLLMVEGQQNQHKISPIGHMFIELQNGECCWVFSFKIKKQQAVEYSKRVKEREKTMKNI